MDIFDLFWNVNQDRRLREARSVVQRASHELQGTQGELAELRVAVDRLALVNQALRELVRERTNLTNADLERQVMEVDLRDGRADGRMAAPGAPGASCPTCGRPNRSDRTKCLYCDATLNVQPVVTHDQTGGSVFDLTDSAKGGQEGR